MTEQRSRRHLERTRRSTADHAPPMRSVRNDLDRAAIRTALTCAPVGLQWRADFHCVQLLGSPFVYDPLRRARKGLAMRTGLLAFSCRTELEDGMPVEALDTLLAIKVINLVPGLCPSDRQVGVVLIEHFNRRTGRCDPGLERIAGLLGISRRTVIRATQRLQTCGLFRKVRHGGYSNRNSYEPSWSRFAELDADWKKKLQEKWHSRQANVSPLKGQSGHPHGDRPVTQTFRDNRHQQTCLKVDPNDANKRLGAHPSSLGQSLHGTRSSDAAHAAAERRWTDALHRRFSSMPVTYGEVIGAIDLPIQNGATKAEMQSPGAGIRYILTRLKIPDSQ